MAFIWVASVILYVLIIRKAAVTTSAAFKTVVVRLSLYILAAILANFPALVNRVQNLVDPRKPIFVLFVLHALCNPLQGLMNGIVYSLSKPLRKAYRALLRRSCRRLCKHKSCCCSNNDTLDEGGRRIRSYEDEDFDEDNRHHHHHHHASNPSKGREGGDEDYYDDSPALASEYDDEEEAYRIYQQTITLPRDSSLFGYSTDSGGFGVSNHPGMVVGNEAQPLLSGSFPNIQTSHITGSSTSSPTQTHVLPNSQLLHHQRAAFNANYGSGSGFSTSEYWSSDQVNTPPNSEYLDS